jgi:hypothetical protein
MNRVAAGGKNKKKVDTLARKAINDFNEFELNLDLSGHRISDFPMPPFMMDR